MTAPRRPECTSDTWMLEQQLRAEMEAEAWRRLRELSHLPKLPQDLVLSSLAPAAPDYHNTGSIVLKALVRFMLAACGAYVAWIAASDSRLGDFEILLTLCAAFMVTLSLTLFGPARGLVHVLSEMMRWMLIIGAALGGMWWLAQAQG